MCFCLCSSSLFTTCCQSTEKSTAPLDLLLLMTALSTLCVCATIRTCVWIWLTYTYVMTECFFFFFLSWAMIVSLFQVCVFSYSKAFVLLFFVRTYVLRGKYLSGVCIRMIESHTAVKKEKRKKNKWPLFQWFLFLAIHLLSLVIFTIAAVASVRFISSAARSSFFFLLLRSLTRSLVVACCQTTSVLAAFHECVWVCEGGEREKEREKRKRERERERRERSSIFWQLYFLFSFFRCTKWKRCKRKSLRSWVSFSFFASPFSLRKSTGFSFSFLLRFLLFSNFYDEKNEEVL